MLFEKSISPRARPRPMWPVEPHMVPKVAKGPFWGWPFKGHALYNDREQKEKQPKKIIYIYIYMRMWFSLAGIIGS